MTEEPISDSSNQSLLRPFYCLSGCTAVGKTELALRWAEENGAEIVNCDSLLFYRGMDIGTAKPTSAELQRVPHHLIDIASPDERMDISLFVERAIESIREIQSRGKLVLVTGGSGFYLKAFFEPVVDAVLVSQPSTDEAEALMAAGLDVAVSELRRRNPQGLEGFDTQNPRRVLKALERCIETGRTVTELKQEFASQRNPLLQTAKALCILERDKAELELRIAKRVELMLEQGLVEEVQRLADLGLENNPSAANAIGYRETLAYIRGEYTLPELCDKIATNTRRLAKKQRTWFRHQLRHPAKRINLSAGNEPDLAELFPEPSLTI